MAKGNSKQQSRTPLLEWVSAIVGLMILLAMLVFLAVQAMRTEHRVPPLMQVEPLRLIGHGQQYVLELKVSNASRQTAAAVQVEGTLKSGGSDVETSNATLSYVPGESHRRGGLVFTLDPRDYGLELRVTGYEQP